MGNSRSKRRSSKSRSSSSFSSSGGHYLAVPSELYDASDWDRKVLSRMVLGGKIAPLVPGSDDELLDLRITLECPICFLYYAECAVNVTACCSKPICSECYLSINGTTDTSRLQSKQTQTQTQTRRRSSSSSSSSRASSDSTSLAVVAASPGAACPFCQSTGLAASPMVKGVQHPNRYGLDQKTFAETVATIKRHRTVAENMDAAAPPILGVSVADRLEHQQNMSDMSDLAELERQTSPALAAYHLSPNSQPRSSSTSPAPLSLGRGVDGRGGWHGSVRGGTQGPRLDQGRMNSLDRQMMQQGHLSEIFGAVGERISNSNSDVRMAIEQMMMEEAIRLSLNAGGSDDSDDPTSGQSVAQNVIGRIGITRPLSSSATARHRSSSRESSPAVCLPRSGEVKTEVETQVQDPGNALENTLEPTGTAPASDELALLGLLSGAEYSSEDGHGGDEASSSAGEKSDSGGGNRDRRASFVPVDEDDEERMIAEALRLSLLIPPNSSQDIEVSEEDGAVIRDNGVDGVDGIEDGAVEVGGSGGGGVGGGEGEGRAGGGGGGCVTSVGDVNIGTKDRGNIGVIVAAMPPEYDAADVAIPECAVKAIRKPAGEVSEQPLNAASEDASDSYSENSMLAVAAGCGDSNRGDVDDEEMKEKIPYPHVMPPSISPASATILADITTAGMVSSSAGESKINGDTV